MATLKQHREYHLGSPIGQCRAVPVNLGDGEPNAFLATYAADFDVDPYIEMFFFPTDTLKMALCSENGDILWKRDLGRGVVPGMWFCPVFPFDLDGDGVDEIWYVNNVNEQHPLGLSGYRLERLDARTGETTGQWEWHPVNRTQSLSHVFRNFIIGGMARDEPVLVTAQGTYGAMHLQGWNADMSLRWTHDIPANSPGARGSHMCPIVDLDGDGVQELMWGERCIELDTGTQRFCADEDVYKGHSDIVIPTHDLDASDGEGEWLLYTCRESDGNAAPRVVLFDAKGQRRWGHVERGHMDMGWVARTNDDHSHTAMSIRIGAKTCGPDGRFHQQMDKFAFDVRTGDEITLPFDPYLTKPVDLDGDGYHEFVRGVPGGDGEVFDRHGQRIGSVGGSAAIVCKFLDHPGEQILSYHKDGTLRTWVDPNAQDTEFAKSRYGHPLYDANRRLSNTGQNWSVLAGI